MNGYFHLRTQTLTCENVKSFLHVNEFFHELFTYAYLQIQIQIFKDFSHDAWFVSKLIVSLTTASKL